MKHNKYKGRKESLVPEPQNLWNNRVVCFLGFLLVSIAPELQRVREVCNLELPTGKDQRSPKSRKSF
jgi:hypothetical protein